MMKNIGEEKTMWVNAARRGRGESAGSMKSADDAIFFSNQGGHKRTILRKLFELIVLLEQVELFGLVVLRHCE
jgi:hypothetical protein